MERKHWTQQLISGFVIGVACILPGLSGSVMAMSMGLYQPILSAMTGLRKAFRTNVRFLTPFVIGGGIGVLLVARALSALAAHALDEITVLFTGLILGGLPDLWRRAVAGDIARRKGNAGVWFVRAGLFAAGFLFMFSLTFLERLFENNNAAMHFDGLYAAISGGILAFATIVPGISSSFLLIYLGVYQPMMDALANIRIRPLLFAGAGGIVVAALMIKLVEWLFRKYTSVCTFIAMGFVIGSVRMVLKWDAFISRPVIHIALLAAGIGLSALIARGFGSGKSDDEPLDAE